MSESPIDKLYADGKSLLDFLDAQKQPSFKSDADNILRKNLLMAIDSYFENEIKRILEGFITKGTDSNLPILSFAQNKGIERQYHKNFDWKENNANSFLGLFGEEFKKSAIADVSGEETLKKSVRDFMEIGRKRNELAHENFVLFSLEKTSEEVYEMFKSANKFIEYLAAKFLKYLKP
jgi:hypothetical protein